MSVHTSEGKEREETRKRRDIYKRKDLDPSVSLGRLTIKEVVMSLNTSLIGTTKITLVDVKDFVSPGILQLGSSVVTSHTDRDGYTRPSSWSPTRPPPSVCVT